MGGWLGRWKGREEELTKVEGGGFWVDSKDLVSFLVLESLGFGAWVEELDL